MTDIHEQLTLRRYSADEARASGKQVRQVYEQSYVTAIESGAEFDSVDAFMHRFRAYAANPRLDMVLAFLGDEPVGQAWGWPLTADTRWWSGITSKPPEPNFTAEDGTRTFALSEIMVKQPHTGHGIAHKLHDALLRERAESRATLLAEPDNEAAYRAYVRWGWRKAAELRPDWPGSPTFDVLMLDLTRVKNTRCG